MKYAWIFDTPAVAGHAAGTSRRIRAGLRLIADDPDFRLTIPVVCLIEAYPVTPPAAHHILDSLAVNPGVLVEHIGTDPHTVVAVGHLAAGIGRAGAAHAAHLARAGDRPAIVFTDAILPVEVMTRPV